MLYYILGIVLAYIVGSFPTAYILVKVLSRRDIREFGSGNVGATNAGRMLGWWAFFIVLVVDILKGFVPVFLSMNMSLFQPLKAYYPLIISAVIVLGHTYSFVIKFKGGKGVAVSLGVFLALAPLEICIAIVAFIITVASFKMISLGSIVASIVLSILVFFYSEWYYLSIFTFIASIFVILKHRDNIRRIFNGTENKIKI